MTGRAPDTMGYMALVDRFVAAPEFSEVHSIIVAAPADTVWEAVTHRDATGGGATRLLLAVRGQLGRLFHGAGERELRSLSEAFVRLAEEPGAEVVDGIVGQWWRFGARDRHPDVTTPEQFVAFAEPGYGKGTFSFAIEALGPARTRVTTETRVVTTDAAAHRSMARYWLLIRVGSGLIRRVMLAGIKRRTLAAACTPV